MNHDILHKLQEHNVRFVHLQFTDILGMSKSVAVPAETIGRILECGLRFDGSSVDAFVRSQETDMYLHPDTATFAILPWSDSKGPTARMICTIKTLDGEPYAGCPRNRLSLCCDALAKQELRIMVSVELEFYLLARDELGAPTTNTRDTVGYFDLAPASPGDETRRAVVLYLQELGIPVEASHHEGSPGQHGVDIAWGDLLTTADRILTTKAVIKRAAVMHGLHATFMPKPADHLGSSCLPLHIKLYKHSKNLFAHRNTSLISDIGKNFAVGMSFFARDFAMITGQLVNSYKREILQPVWRDLGPTEVRVPPERDENSRLVLRTADPACNPYLALFCAVEAGLWGMRTKQAMTENTAWPAHLGEAVNTFANSDFCRRTLGEVLYANLLTAKQLEWSIFLSSVNSWETKQYLEKY